MRGQGRNNPVIEKISYADGAIFGTPIYFRNITGALQSFLERLWFPYSSFNKHRESLAPKKVKSGAIFTMHVSPDNVSREEWEGMYEAILNSKNIYFESLFGSYEKLFSCNTTHFDDYNKYEALRFDPIDKARQKKEQFPIDCQKAFEMGARIASKD